MNTIVFNILGGYITPEVECTALRAAYIFSKNPITAGNGGNVFINYKSMFAGNPTFDFKILVLQNSFINDQKKVNELTTIKQEIKKQKAIKHKSNKLIIAIKQVERSVDKMYEQYLEAQMNSMKKMSFFDFLPLAEKNQIFYLPMNYIHKEGLIKGDGFDEYFNASDILKYALEKNEVKGISAENKPYYIFCLTLNFNEHENFYIEPIKSNDVNAENDNNIVLEHFFTVPDINLFSTPELESVRNSFPSSQNEWYRNMSNWSEICQENPSKSLSYFKENILPLRENIQKEFDENNIVQYAKKLMDYATVYEIYIGLIPVKILYNYYLTQNVVEQETIDILDLYLEENKKEKYRVPVMVIKNKLSEIKDNSIDATVVSVKKSLDID